MRPLKMLQIGVGGYGAAWLRDFVPPVKARGLVETVAVCDIDEQALGEARDFLGLPASQCFTDAAQACRQADADFALISTPPWDHADHVAMAADAGMDVLCEKPIAASIEDTARIVRTARETGRRIAFTMTHRFDQAHSTLRREVHSGEYGALDYIAFRLTGELRRFASWGRFRHEMDDVMLVEAAIHHFDILRDLAGAAPASIFATSWNPPWGEFAGDSQVLAIMRFGNDVRASYESTACNAVSINEYFKGTIRAEFDKATLILDGGRLERMYYDPTGQEPVRRPGSGETVEPGVQDSFGNVWIIERFVQWLRGGEPMPTRLEQTLQSQAMVFAALESARTGKQVDVRAIADRFGHLAWP